MVALCLFVQAQLTKPLTIGDTVPDITFTNLINYPTRTAKLSDFKGKLVILDFWATWCGSCIAKFPELQRLQKEFNKDLQIILVNGNSTGDTKASISQFLSKRAELLKPINLPIVPEEEIVNSLFPYNSLPHYVWISAERKVLAITSSEDITASNILIAKTGEPLNLKSKVDFNKENLYLLDTTAPKEQIGEYSVLIKGRMKNLNAGGGFEYTRMDGSKPAGYFFANLSLYAIYYRIAAKLIENFDNDRGKIQFSSSDSIMLGTWNIRSKDSVIKWYDRYGYTLDVYAPGNTPKRIFEIALNVLNSGSPFTTLIEKKKINCFVISRADQQKEPGVDKKTPSSIQFSTLKSTIKTWLNGEVPLVDNSRLRGLTYLKADKSPSGLEQVRIILAENNLILSEQVLEIPIMTITRKPI